MNIKNTTYPQNLISDIEKQTSVYLDVDYSRVDVMNGISTAIAMLSDQEQKMIIMRYRYHYTLEELGNHFDLTSERARQIIARALRKLTVKPKRMLITEGLEGYIKFEAKRIANCKIKIALHQEYMRGYEKGIASLSRRNEDNEDVTEDKSDSVLVQDLNLSVRTTNCLVRANLDTLEKLLEVDSPEQIMKIRNLGKKSAGEVAKRLNELDLIDTAWNEFLKFFHESQMITETSDSFVFTDDYFDGEFDK